MKNVKYSFFIVVFITLDLFYFAGNAVAQSLHRDSWAKVSKNKKGEITVFYYPEPGFAFTDSKGKLDGIEIEIFRQFSNYLRNVKGVHLDMHFVKEEDFSTLLADVKNGSGGVFGAGNVTITQKRKQYLKFTPEYLPNLSIMVTGTQTPNFKNLSDLDSEYKNFSAVVYGGTTNASVVKKIKQQYDPQLKITYVNSDEAALKAITVNPHEFTYVDLGVYWMAKRDHMKIKRQPIGDQKSGNIGFIMPLHSDWLIPFNEFFNIGNGYRSNPAYRDILVSYLGVDMTHLLQMADE